MKNEDIKLILDTQFTAVRATMLAVEDGMNRRFDSVDEANKIRNHRLEKAEDAITDLEKADISFENYQMNCPANKVAKKLSRPRTWALIGTAFVATIFLSIWLFHNIDWLKTLENRTGVELIENETE